MDFVTIVTLGIVATIYMLGFDAAAIRLGLIRGNMIRAVGTLVIPEPIRSPLTRVVFNLLMGIAFCGGYAYLIEVLELETLRDFLSIGVLIGFVHGAFVSFFFAIGISAFLRGDEVKPFTIPSAVINSLGHVLFGALVGLGLGFYHLEGSAVRYVAFLTVVGIAAEGLLMLLVPRRLKPLHVSVWRGI
jgi:hypothetical protein